jgi:DNA-binding beta-propeller fold protein YncE
MPSPAVVAAREAEAKLDILWSERGPELERPWTWSPTIDAEGRIWAASSFDDVFWIIDREGTYLESWGASGSDDGQFQFEAEGNGFGAIAFGADGGFYVADSGNSRVQQFGADRRFVRAWGSFGTDEGEFTVPIDLGLDGEGNVYVFDDGRQDVQVFDPDGAHLRTIGADLGPYIAVDKDGTVFAFNNRQDLLLEHSPEGDVRTVYDTSDIISFATGLDIAPSGDLFIPSSDTGSSNVAYETLAQLGRDGTVRHIWPNGAEAVAVDPAGDRLYLTYSDVNPAVEAYALPAD